MEVTVCWGDWLELFSKKPVWGVAKFSLMFFKYYLPFQIMVLSINITAFKTNANAKDTLVLNLLTVFNLVFYKICPIGFQLCFIALTKMPHQLRQTAS